MGATLWKVYVDCYALKCTKHHYLQELVCFYNNISILLYFLRWQVGAPPSPPPKSATAYTITVITSKALEYKAWFKHKIQMCRHCYVFLSDESLFT